MLRVEIGDILTKRYEALVFLENDLNAAVIGAQRCFEKNIHVRNRKLLIWPICICASGTDNRGIESVDDGMSGRYISLRQTLTLVVTVILSVIGGKWMDHMDGQYVGFAVLFAIAGAMGICEIILLIRTTDSTSVHQNHQSCILWDIVRIPFQNRCFTGIVCYILVFYFLLYIADSFTMVYMMKYLALPYQMVTAMYLVISLLQVFWLRIWGKISDRWGYDFVLKISVWLFAGETLFMSFAAPESWFLFIPVAFLVSSVANAGFVIAVFNRRYELMPEENRIVYNNLIPQPLGLGPHIKKCV